MLKLYKCPNCQKVIETNQELCAEIACPYCDKEFAIRAAHEVRKDAGRDALFRVAIPIGYVLFVAVPLALTIWFFVNRAEKQQQALDAEAQAAQEAKVARDEKPAPAPRPKRPPKQKGDDGTKPDPDEPEAKPDPKRPPESVPEPKPVETKVEPEPKPKPAEPDLDVAPEPRELPEVFVAPEPRAIAWKLPPMEYESPWQKVGSVDLRVAGVAITKVPIIDAKEQITESEKPMLVVVMEVRLNNLTRKRDLNSWTYGQARYMIAFTGGGRQLAHIDVPLGSKVNTGLPYKQPIPQDGTAVRDVMVFAAPPDGSGELSIRLDGDRVGEGSADIWFKIPPSAWKK